jgi:hypothetical protein
LAPFLASFFAIFISQTKQPKIRKMPVFAERPEGCLKSNTGFFRPFFGLLVDEFIDEFTTKTVGSVWLELLELSLKIALQGFNNLITSSCSSGAQATMEVAPT